MRAIVQASEQPRVRSMLKIHESCTTEGTTQMIDRWQNRHMLVTSRNDAKRKIVMISLHRPATGHGKVHRMACCAGGGRVWRNASHAASRAALERPGQASHAIILSGIADNTLMDMRYLAMRKTLIQAEAGVLKQEKGNEVMYMTLQQPDQAAFPVGKSAAALGIDEFSLLSRIQMGEINTVRATSGEIMIPESELKRLALSSLRELSDESGEQQKFSDHKRRGGRERTAGNRAREIVCCRVGCAWPVVGSCADETASGGNLMVYCRCAEARRQARGGGRYCGAGGPGA